MAGSDSRAKKVRMAPATRPSSSAGSAASGWPAVLPCSCRFPDGGMWRMRPATRSLENQDASQQEGARPAIVCALALAPPWHAPFVHLRLLQASHHLCQPAAVLPTPGMHCAANHMPKQGAISTSIAQHQMRTCTCCSRATTSARPHLARVRDTSAPTTAATCDSSASLLSRARAKERGQYGQCAQH